MIKNNLVSFGLAAVLGLGGFAFADDHGHSDAKTVVSVASSDEKNFSTLVTALKAADLVQTLQGDGPYTVFAPTNEAFEKLPKGTLESLLKAKNKDQLKSILKYHVVKGKVPAKTVVGLEKAETVQGESVTIKTEEGKVRLNGKSNVTQTDLMAGNGVIHVIDTVLMPKKGK